MGLLGFRVSFLGSYGFASLSVSIRFPFFYLWVFLRRLNDREEDALIIQGILAKSRSMIVLPLFFCFFLKLGFAKRKPLFQRHVVRGES